MLKYLLCLLLFIGTLNGAYPQFKDSVRVKQPWTQRTAFKTLFAPVVLATGSLILFDPNGGEHTIIENIPGFSSHLDDYLQFVPIAMVYGLDIAGVEGRNDPLNQTILLLKAEILMAGLVFSLKAITKVPRPNGASDNSFPSGHTAQAFLAATFLSKEYGQKSIWYSVSGYAMASTVGVYRILKNRHRLTDVLMGASIGILTTNIVYLTHKHKWGRKEKHYSILPSFSHGSYGVYMSFRL